jgi:hypothetical protein
MKTFEEFMNEEKVEKVEISPNLYAEGKDLIGLNEIKSLLNSYDWFTMMIDDLTTMRNKEAKNKNILSELKKHNVTKIVCITPEADAKALQYQEVNI